MLTVYEGFFNMLDPKLTRAYEAPLTEPQMVDEPDDVESANQQIAAAGDAAQVAEFGEPEIPEEPTSEPVVGDLGEPSMEDVPEEDDIDDPIDEELPELEGGAVDGVDDPAPTTEADPTDDLGEDPMIEYNKKMNIHKNTVQLLSIVTISRDAFEQKFGSKLEGSQYHDYHRIINGFDDLIEIMNETLTKKFANGNYNTLIRYYVSMVKVYDILTKMTDNFVNDYIKENEETNS